MYPPAHLLLCISNNPTVFIHHLNNGNQSSWTHADIYIILTKPKAFNHVRMKVLTALHATKLTSVLLTFAFLLNLKMWSCERETVIKQLGFTAYSYSFMRSTLSKQHECRSGIRMCALMFLWHCLFMTDVPLFCSGSEDAPRWCALDFLLMVRVRSRWAIQLIKTFNFSTIFWMGLVSWWVFITPNLKG